MDLMQFIDRAFQHMPAPPFRDYHFESWKYGGKPVSEGVGTLANSGGDVEKMVQCLMDVDHYVGNVDHVIECRSIEDSRFAPPKAKRFYEKINVPLVAKLQMELVIEDQGEREGWRLITWRLLDEETAALNPKQGARSDYNVGFWALREDAVAYALASASRKDDVGRLKYMAIAKGADAMAPKVMRGNIDGLLRWAKK